MNLNIFILTNFIDWIFEGIFHLLVKHEDLIVDDVIDATSSIWSSIVGVWNFKFIVKFGIWNCKVIYKLRLLRRG